VGGGWIGRLFCTGQGPLLRSSNLLSGCSCVARCLRLKSPVPSMKLPTNTLWQRDCIEGMSELPDHSVDLVLADPPYNLSKGNMWKWDNSVALPGMGGNWNKAMESWDSMPLTDYFKFTVLWLTQIKRITKPTGSIWICGTYHNIGIINFALQLLEIEIINEVVWYKRNSFPNLSGRRLTASHETVLWAHSGSGKKRKYHFDYERSKKLSEAWDLMKVEDKQLRTVWDIPNNKARSELAHGKHPTQKPVRLFSRIIDISGKASGIMLTPFAGSGTECIAAYRAGMSYIGYETDATYFKLATQRLEDEKSGLNLAGANDQIEEAPPKSTDD
jgi:site-specific DNA-methyltransferase (adenine-specific)